MPTADIIRVVNAMHGFAEDQIKSLSIGIVANLVETTPVDTGWARANWIPHIGADNPGEVTAQGDPATAAARQNAGLAEITAYNLSNGRVFISNHVPYIGALNNGHSQQAPAGFVEAAIDKAIREV